LYNYTDGKTDIYSYYEQHNIIIWHLSMNMLMCLEVLFSCQRTHTLTCYM